GKCQSDFMPCQRLLSIGIDPSSAQDQIRRIGRDYVKPIRGRCVRWKSDIFNGERSEIALEYEYLFRKCIRPYVFPSQVCQVLLQLYAKGKSKRISLPHQ